MTHDGIGNRKTAGSATFAYDRAARLTTTFVWDNGGTPNILTDGTTSYLYGPGRLPIEQISSTASSWFVHDQIGSTLALLDGTGAVAGCYTYTPYGVASSSGSASTSLRYTGQYTDGESGLVYLRARYYDRAMALFISVDPLLDTTRTPYAYADGDPIGRKDPSGLWTGGVCLTSHLGGLVFWSGQVCIQIDGHGDLGVSGTMAGGGSTPGIGAGVGLQGSNADQIEDLNGPFCTAGVSGGEPYFGGADLSWGADSQGRPVYVGELSGGVGAELPFPAAVHGGVSDTWSASFGIPKAWQWLTSLFD